MLHIFKKSIANYFKMIDVENVDLETSTLCTINTQLV